jgi:hypothetical protein
MEEAVKLPDAAERGFELLAADAVREANPALRGDFLGALLCRADAIAESRLALPALRAWLARGPGYEWLPGREAVAPGPRPCSAGLSPAPSAGGPASTARSSGRARPARAACTTAARSPPAWSW